MNEKERLKACEDIAFRMYIAGMGWNYDAVERLTQPEPPSFKALRDLMRMPEPTPVERGVLDRYQDKRRRRRR